MDLAKIEYGVIFSRPDGSFVVDNYHVIDGDEWGKYKHSDIAKYAKANPDKVKPEPKPKIVEVKKPTLSDLQDKLDFLLTEVAKLKDEIKIAKG